MSENHAMSFVVERKKTQKADHFVIKFFDPNLTLNYKRVVLKNLNSFNDLKFEELTPFPTTYKEDYFENIKSGILAVYNDPKIISSRNYNKDLIVLKEFSSHYFLYKKLHYTTFYNLDFDLELMKKEFRELSFNEKMENLFSMGEEESV